MWQRGLFVGYLAVIVLCHHGSKARILTQCGAANELYRAGTPKVFVSNWVCLMKSVSGFNTSKISERPGPKASRSFGIFQISSFENTWCIQGRKGGKCNTKCEDFLNDDISDDIVCAKKIFDTVGFKYWTAWDKNCKSSNNLPDLSNCRIRRNSI